MLYVSLYNVLEYWNFSQDGVPKFKNRKHLVQRIFNFHSTGSLYTYGKQSKTGKPICPLFVGPTTTYTQKQNCRLTNWPLFYRINTSLWRAQCFFSFPVKSKSSRGSHFSSFITGSFFSSRTLFTPVLLSSGHFFLIFTGIFFLHM